MSVGNLKTDGQKGNNFPWQLQMLKGLQVIIDALAGIKPCCPPAERSASIETYNNIAGSLPSPIYSFSIANIGTAPGLVDGQFLPAGVTINYDPGVNNTILGLSFDALGTTFLITYIT